jgi:gluconolactonase
MTSNRLGNQNSAQQWVNIYAMDWATGNIRTILESSADTLTATSLPMANGAVKNGSRVIVCSQGRDRIGGALFDLNPQTGDARLALDNWHGLQFNSPNDVILDRNGDVWFTDPMYGYEQGFRASPQLGSWVWYFSSKTQTAYPVADGFTKPNGLAFNVDETILYVTDSGFYRGDGTWSTDRPHAIYAFDVVAKNSGDKPQLKNRRLFAVVDHGIPDGIKVDGDDRVFVGCGDGVHIFDPSGWLLGKILVPGHKGVANLAFAGPYRNELLMLAETAVYSVQLAVTPPKR